MAASFAACMMVCGEAEKFMGLSLISKVYWAAWIE
jgi:hypothetical protein